MPCGKRLDLRYDRSSVESQWESGLIKELKITKDIFLIVFNDLDA